MLRKKYYIVRKIRYGEDLYFKRIQIPKKPGTIICSQFNCRFGDMFDENEIACLYCTALGSKVQPRRFTYLYVDKKEINNQLSQI